MVEGWQESGGALCSFCREPISEGHIETEHHLRRLTRRGLLSRKHLAILSRGSNAAADRSTHDNPLRSIVPAANSAAAGQMVNPLPRKRPLACHEHTKENEVQMPPSPGTHAKAEENSCPTAAGGEGRGEMAPAMLVCKYVYHCEHCHYPAKNTQEMLEHYARNKLHVDFWCVPCDTSLTPCLPTDTPPTAAGRHTQTSVQLIKTHDGSAGHRNCVNKLVQRKRFSGIYRSFSCCDATFAARPQLTKHLSVCRHSSDAHFTCHLCAAVRVPVQRADHHLSSTTHLASLQQQKQLILNTVFPLHSAPSLTVCPPNPDEKGHRRPRKGFREKKARYLQSLIHCIPCSIQFSSLEDFFRHYSPSSHRDQDCFRCLICREFIQYDSMDTHMRSEHPSLLE